MALDELRQAILLGPHRAMLRRFIARHLEAVPLCKRALDLGCGEGPYADLLGARCEVVIGCDRKPGPPYACFGSDAGVLPLRDGSFDLVFSTQVLEHVAEPLAVLGEAHRVLRPGGVLLMTAPQMVALHEAPYDFFRYTTFGLQHLLKRAGFHGVQVEGMGGFSSMVAQQLEFRLLWDRGLKPRWARRAELGIGRLALGLVAAADWSQIDSRYCLNMIARAEK